MNRKFAVLIFFIFCFAGQTMGQTSPFTGDWSKQDNDDLRVMTWNVEDNVRRLVSKTNGSNAWSAIARVIAALKPDVLVLQEAGDNGTFNSVDSVSALTTTLELLMHGGSDPFNGGAAVGAYVQLWAPSYDLPYIFVTSTTDGFNRNVIMSRYPFSDLNGDGKSTYNDLLFITADQYAPGGLGGVRGFQFVEIDLPDNTYVGDLVIGNGHLKCCNFPGDGQQREDAARNVAYFVDYWYNGAGTGTPDPNGKIVDFPLATNILDPDTPVVLLGDWNEDENTGGKGPADWMTKADTAGGTDGTDRDRSDMIFDDARDPFGFSRNTQGSSKLDYIAWQDSIATLRSAALFKSLPMSPASYPPELIGFGIGSNGPDNVSTTASDHFPVMVDLQLNTAVGFACCDGITCSLVADQATCNGSGGIYFGDGLFCEDVVCGGACCNGLSCSQSPDIATCNGSGGIYFGDESVCDDVICGGACCNGLSCSQSPDSSTCTGGGGQYFGDETVCDDVVCTGGACCDGLSCFFASDSMDCSASGGDYYIDGADCGSVICGGACCQIDGCTLSSQDGCGNIPSYVCDHTSLFSDPVLYPDYASCFGDIDGDGFVTPADRGFVSANLDGSNHIQVCRNDVDGDGFITPSDRGFISANIDLCIGLPDYMDGSGTNDGHPDSPFPGAADPRYPSTYAGNDTSCPGDCP